MNLMGQPSLLLLGGFACLLSAILSEGAPLSTFKWCVISQDELSLCTKLTARFQELDTKNKTWTCVLGEGPLGCIDAIGDPTRRNAANAADFASFDGTPIYDAADKWGLIPIVKEDLTTGANYYAVGVMRKNKVSNGFKLSDLKGKRSCHTGYRRSAGWTVPLGTLVLDKVMEPVSKNPSVANDIESVQEFFKATCAPGASPTTRVCSGCPAGDPCDASSNYWDYHGAFRCLVEGYGDVAFTKHSIPIDYSAGGLKADGSWKDLKSSDEYSLVCPKGGIRPVTAFADCHFATAPAHAVMTRANLDPDDIAEFQKVMEKAADDAIVEGLIFKSNNKDGLIFHADATSFEALPNGTTAATYLGDFSNAIKTFRTIESVPATAAKAASSFFLLAVMSLITLFLFQDH